MQYSNTLIVVEDTVSLNRLAQSVGGNVLKKRLKEENRFFYECTQPFSLNDHLVKVYLVALRDDTKSVHDRFTRIRLFDNKNSQEKKGTIVKESLTKHINSLLNDELSPRSKNMQTNTLFEDNYFDYYDAFLDENSFETEICLTKHAVTDIRWVEKVMTISTVCFDTILVAIPDKMIFEQVERVALQLLRHERSGVVHVAGCFDPTNAKFEREMTILNILLVAVDQMKSSGEKEEEESKNLAKSKRNLRMGAAFKHAKTDLFEGVYEQYFRSNNDLKEYFHDKNSSKFFSHDMRILGYLARKHDRPRFLKRKVVKRRSLLIGVETLGSKSSVFGFTVKQSPFINSVQQAKEDPPAYFSSESSATECYFSEKEQFNDEDIISPTLNLIKTVVNAEFKKRPRPLSTPRIFQLAMKFLKMSAPNIETTLRKLYHHGLISYPFEWNVDCCEDYGDFRPKLINELVSEINNPKAEWYVPFLKQFLPPENDNVNKKNRPIVPLKYVDKATFESLFGEELNTDFNLPTPCRTTKRTGLLFGFSGYYDLYDLICRFFLASVSDDCVVSVTSVFLQDPKTETIFAANARTVTQKGWLLPLRGKNYESVSASENSNMENFFLKLNPNSHLFKVKEIEIDENFILDENSEISEKGKEEKYHDCVDEHELILNMGLEDPSFFQSCQFADLYTNLFSKKLILSEDSLVSLTPLGKAIGRSYNYLYDKERKIDLPSFISCIIYCYVADVYGLYSTTFRDAVASGAILDGKKREQFVQNPFVSIKPDDVQMFLQSNGVVAQPAFSRKKKPGWK